MAWAQLVGAPITRSPKVAPCVCFGLVSPALALNRSFAPAPFVLIACAVTVGVPPSLDGVVVTRNTSPTIFDEPELDAPQLQSSDDTPPSLEIEHVDREIVSATAAPRCACAAKGSDAVVISAMSVFMIPVSPFGGACPANALIGA